MTSYKVHEPLEISCEKTKSGRALVFEDFWSRHSKAGELADKRGCYVFALRTGRGLKPLYVGKALKSFQKETFAATNLKRFQNGFASCGKGTPVVFFVAHPGDNGRLDAREIEQVEEYLIQVGAAKNPELENVKSMRHPTWSIQGVIRSGQGKRSRAEQSFRRLFDME